eukprot:TRINITY_DN73480_c0_g1_i3.p2 TRINITY_DN73480_c0_g1~~TRINITY_DN73480_c0_g1_i3.p2  ORF type:complete len:304 (-),score=53.61 TRINITY_DN73480_c0_g1_i3:137-1048(-)
MHDVIQSVQDQVETEVQAKSYEFFGEVSDVREKLNNKIKFVQDQMLQIVDSPLTQQQIQEVKDIVQNTAQVIFSDHMQHKSNEAVNQLTQIQEALLFQIKQNNDSLREDVKQLGKGLQVQLDTMRHSHVELEKQLTPKLRDNGFQLDKEVSQERDDPQQPVQQEQKVSLDQAEKEKDTEKQNDPQQPLQQEQKRVSLDQAEKEKDAKKRDDPQQPLQQEQRVSLDQAKKEKDTEYVNQVLKEELQSLVEKEVLSKISSIQEEVTSRFLTQKLKPLINNLVNRLRNNQEEEIKEEDIQELLSSP